MKQIGRDILTAIFVGVLVPAVILQIGIVLMDRKPVVAQTVPPEPETQISVTEETQPETIPVSLRLETGETEIKDLEEYILGALMGEMPAYFEEEALKAQAVAARTYACRAMEGGKHADGSLCTNFACCQAYIAPEKFEAQGASRESIQKLRNAVEATAGQVLTYEGTLIEATYFSCSGGRTEDAVAVWGSDVPYLRSVESPGEEDAAHYEDSVYYTWEDLQTLLQISGKDIGETAYTAGGGVDRITIGGKEFRGTKLRTLLNLRSTVFTLVPEENGVTIQTRGYGHRVGMSQYGADAMAAAGSDYREILAHYYPGTVLEEDYGCTMHEGVIK